MKAGKVSEAILKRSVLKTIKYKTSEVSLCGNIGNDAIKYEDVLMASSVAGLLFNNEHLHIDCRRAICNAVNNVAAEGGYAKGIIVDVILPDKKLEPALKELMRYISKVCEEMKLQISGGNTEISKAVRDTIVTFTAFGKSMYSDVVNPKEWAKSGFDIVMSKQIGISGTVMLVKEKYTECLERFQQSYIRQALVYEDKMDVRAEAKLAAECGVRVMHDVSRGGIYSALWQLAEKTNKGVEAIMDNIDVKQETIEFTELFGVNPYKMMSDGAMLMVCENGEELAKILNNEGIDAKIIGKLTDNNDKVILKNEDRRHIEPPKRDELEILLY